MFISRRFSTRPDTGASYQENLSIPSNFRLMDISKDKKFMAIIDNDFKLQAYGIECDQGVIKPTRHLLRNIECCINCDHSLFVFLSVASETGYVAVSFAQLDKSSGLFVGGLHDPKYMKCRIYKRNNNGDVTHIPLQGRAVFTSDKLALVEDWTLKILDAKTLSLKYFLDLSELKQSYEGMIGAEKLARHTTWAEYFPVQGSNNLVSAQRKDGDTLIALTRHIKNNILVTTYRGCITKIWSILDGSLIISFKTARSEYIMAISEDNRFIATYNDTTKKVIIYCAKSALPLHEYTPRCMENGEENATVTFIRFGSCQHYLIITGTINDSNNQLNKKQTIFFELWSISQEKRLVYTEKETDLMERTLIPFVMEIEPTNPSIKKEYDHPYFATQFNGVFMKKSRENSSNVVFERFLLLNQEPTEFENGQLWNTYPFRRLSKKILRLRGVNNNEIVSPLDEKNNLVTYLIENGNQKYILRFGLTMVQLWKLNKFANNETNESDKFDFTPIKENQPTRPGRIQPQTQQRDQEQDQKYYKSIKKSKLLYIRSFKGQHYLPLSTFREDWEIKQHKVAKIIKPGIYFMQDKGRILIDIQYKDKNKDKKEKLVKDEIFLDIPDLENDTPETPETSTASSSRTSNISTLNFNSPAIYHEIESYSQTLHYLHFFIKKQAESQENEGSEVLECGKVIFEQTSMLLDKLLFERRGNTIKYFNTISGSKTLAMLASFPLGQKIIWRITQENTPIPMKIFSYPLERKKSENLLTVLIQESKYDLFQFLFNQTIIDYCDEGVGNLSAFIDVLLCLQEEKSSARLLSCIQKLSYLPVKFKRSALLESEYYKMHRDTPADDDESSSLEYHESFTALEQINKYRAGYVSGCFSYINYQIRKSFQKKTEKSGPSAKQNAKKYAKKAQVCIVPLPYFNSYRIYPEKSLMEDLTRNHRNSLFTRTALSDFENTIFKQGYTVMEVLVSYKWRAFAKVRFQLILLLQVTYYTSIAIGISSAEEIFGYEPGTRITHPGQIVSLVTALILGLLLLYQEFRQMIVVRWSYLKSFYNYLDLASFIVPLIAFFLMRYNGPGLYEVSSVSMLILWIHFILRLRVFRAVGYLLEMVIQLSAKIVPVTFIMILVVIAFTHSFFVLLRKRDDLFIEEQPDEGDDVNNVFSNVFFAFITTWFFIFGVFDPLFDGDLGTYPMALILAVIFSLIIVLILFNVVIALMSGTVEDISTTGTKCWIGHYASVVAEVELFWCFLSQRLSKNNNPIYIYYNANRETVELHHKKIKKETEKLKKKLKEHKEVNEFSWIDED